MIIILHFWREKFKVIKIVNTNSVKRHFVKKEFRSEKTKAKYCKRKVCFV